MLDTLLRKSLTIMLKCGKYSSFFRRDLLNTIHNASFKPPVIDFEDTMCQNGVENSDIHSTSLESSMYGFFDTNGDFHSGQN